MTDQPNDPQPVPPPSGLAPPPPPVEATQPVPSSDQPGGAYGPGPAAPPAGGGYGASPPSGYAQPSGGYPPGGPAEGGSSVSSADASGFFGALFDFSFTRPATAKIVKLVYLLIVVFAAFAYLAYAVIAFNVSAAFGVLVLLVLGPILGIVTLAFWRMTLEFYLNVARMSEDMRVMRSRDRPL